MQGLLIAWQGVKYIPYPWTAFSHTHVVLLLKANRFFFSFLFPLNIKWAVTCFYIICHQNLLDIAYALPRTLFQKRFTAFCVWNYCAVPSSITGSNKAPVPHKILAYQDMTPLWHHVKHQYCVSAVQNILCKFLQAL